MLWSVKVPCLRSDVKSLTECRHGISLWVGLRSMMDIHIQCFHAIWLGQELQKYGDLGEDMYLVVLEEILDTKEEKIWQGFEAAELRAMGMLATDYLA